MQYIPVVAGPFAVVTLSASVSVAGGGDFALAVADDDAAYIAYNGWSNGTWQRITAPASPSLAASSSSACASSRVILSCCNQPRHDESVK